MSLYKKTIKAINELFADEPVEGEVPMTLDVKTADGRILRVSDMAVDATVVEITEDGEVPLEDETYTLEDGNQIVVVAGVITEIIPGEAEDKEAEDAEADEPEMMEKFYDVFLKDGKAAHVVNTKEGEMNVGDKFTIEGKDALPGNYELSTGEVLAVGEAGVIDSIAPASTEGVVDEVSDEATSDEEIQGVINNLRNLVNQIKELKSQFAEVKETISGLQKENTELKEEVNKFSGAPSAKPTDTTIKFNAASKDEKLKFFGRK